MDAVLRAIRHGVVRLKDSKQIHIGALIDTCKPTLGYDLAALVIEFCTPYDLVYNTHPLYLYSQD